VVEEQMTLFIDSGNLTEISKYFNLGIIRGVTTNPTILLKDGLKREEIREHIIKIANLIYPYPLSLEVTSNDPGEMYLEAVKLASLSNSINIKIPIHGPNGELENLVVVKHLVKEGIKVNVTAMMSAQQCLVAALSGATYVSLFGGRVNNMGYNCVDEIKKVRYLIDTIPELNYTKMIIGSTREVLNIIEWLSAGAHIVTVTPNLLEGMIVHPYSKDNVQMFINDAVKMGGSWIDT
jgi:transaldolase